MVKDIERFQMSFIAIPLVIFFQVKNGLVLVIGSQSPWIETILLEKGAKHIVTLEYKPLRNQYPGITTVTPSGLQEMLKNGNFSKEEDKFDAVVTFSSIEHSGLGRYLDMLNPWGDLITMAKSWCLTKKGGRALIGVPADKTDAVYFNAARKYGPIMLSHLFANWNQVYTDDRYLLTEESKKEALPENKDFGYQPIYILEK